MRARGRPAARGQAASQRQRDEWAGYLEHLVLWSVKGDMTIAVAREIARVVVSLRGDISDNTDGADDAGGAA